MGIWGYTTHSRFSILGRRVMSRKLIVEDENGYIEVAQDVYEDLMKFFNHEEQKVIDWLAEPCYDLGSRSPVDLITVGKTKLVRDYVRTHLDKNIQ